MTVVLLAVAGLLSAAAGLGLWHPSDVERTVLAVTLAATGCRVLWPYIVNQEAS